MIPDNTKWINVDSSNIEKYAYNEADQTLHITFHNGTVYQYNDVPVSVWEDFQKAKSKGKFFCQNIKTHYIYWKMN